MKLLIETDREGKNMTTHHLKIKPEFYNAVLTGKKKFELRENDRFFEGGDTVILEEYEEDSFTGRFTSVTISYILKNVPEYGLAPGYCIFGWE